MDLDKPFGGEPERRYKRTPRGDVSVNMDAGAANLDAEYRRSLERKQKLMQQMTNMQGSGGESYDPTGMMED